MHFSVITDDGEYDLFPQIEKVYVVGYSGRNQKLVQDHIRELKVMLNVSPPAHVPEVYPYKRDILMLEESMKVSGMKTCGEAEYVLLISENHIFVGLGSDHTDRERERDDVWHAKAVCPKPLGRHVWSYEDVSDHWDSLVIKSWQKIGDKTTPYQSGGVTQILEPDRILDTVRNRTGENPNNCVIFSGTVPLLDEYRFGDEFLCELTDPLRKRKLELSYKVETAEIGEKK